METTRRRLALTRGSLARLESAPLMGEHNSYVFEGILGISSDEVSNLIETQVIY
mgnify:CR=1 FL=1